MSASDEYAAADTVPASDDAVRDDLLSALEVIESQPVGDRAQAYGALHEELARRLDAGEPRRP